MVRWGKKCRTHQVDELQDVVIQRQIRSLSDRVNDWFTRRCSETGVDSSQLRTEYLQSFSVAMSRAIFVQDKWVLVPVIDSVEVPGTSTEPGQPVMEANCRVEVEDMGEGRQLLMLVASCNLKEGDVMVRAVPATAEDMLLQHGAVVEADLSTELSLKAYLSESSQAQAVQRLVSGALPGRLFGDVIVPGLVKPYARFDGDGGTRMDDVAAAVGDTFLYAALLLSSNTEEPQKLEAGQIRDEFLSLAGAQKRGCLQELLQLMNSCLGEFPTSPTEDEKLLRSVRGCRRLAVSFRLYRKQALRQAISGRTFFLLVWKSWMEKDQKSPSFT